MQLSGLYLTDTLTVRNKYRIPALSFIGVGQIGGFALYFANDGGSKAAYVNFKLNRDGDSIGLYDTDLTKIDEITLVRSRPRAHRHKPDLAVTRLIPAERHTIAGCTKRLSSDSSSVLPKVGVFIWGHSLGPELLRPRRLRFFVSQP